jgi:imidazolonepropionase-like amidohydrolase/Tol biopolymer transport system component
MKFRRTFDVRWAAILAALMTPPVSFAAPGVATDSDAEGADSQLHQMIWQGPTEKVEFTTDEGTWLNLDVSPDGTRIVFDMLGDLYLVPIEGGEAQRLTTTLAQEVQPRFSPDGNSLAYISDANGGNNIFVMDLASKEERPITTEKFRSLTNPRWHPNGSGIVARKHFTGSRSLGSGEMWFYHLDGGSGVQLTTKRNEQQDENDPVYSPDGRYLFYTQDATPGPYFQYNKNPHEGIYVTRRLDLDTGENIALLGGPGGAVRPEPSPDGRYLAYVKRIQTDSALMLYDRRTGQNQVLYRELDHDQQEVWALFGLYPNFAWTPDSESIVFWAAGKLHRINVESKAVVGIPFTASVSQVLAKTTKATPKLGVDEVSSMMLRDFATSPDGRYVVFHSLGHLYYADVQSPKPKRLTKLDGFEYAPQFSADGKYLVFAHWQDESYGSIYRGSWRGAKGVSGLAKITSEPGHYQHPDVNNQGVVVYQKQTGNSFRGLLYGLEPGIYVSGNNGKARRILREGRKPIFLNDDLIAYEHGGGDKRFISTVQQDGTQQRTRYSLGSISEWAIDPAGEHIAYRKDFKVFVAPIVLSAKEQLLGGAELSSIQASSGAGRYLHWSSQALHWSLGSTYSSVAMTSSEAKPTEQTLELTFPVSRSNKLIAYQNARIIPVVGVPIELGTLLVQGNKIVAIGDSDSVEVPVDAIVIDVSGKTIVPGFIDTHAHHSGHFYSSPLPETNASYLANLAFGVTTTHDPSSNTETVFSLAELQRAGTLIGPRIFSTGSVLYGAKSNSFVDIQSLDDARMHLKRLQAQGAFSVKSYNQPRREQRQWIMQAAAELGMSVYPEGGATFYNQLTHILDGSTGLEHNLPVAPLYEDVLRLWQGAPHVGYTQTLVVNYAGLNSEYYWYQDSNVWEHELLGRYTPLAELTARSRRVAQAAEDDYFFKTVAASGKALQDRGVLVTVGAHGQLQGLGYHWEMWSLAEGGMTPEKVLQAATIDGARYLNMDREIGSLEVGKLADFVVLNKNPLDDIRNTDSVAMVSIDGRLYDSSSMNQVAPQAKERGALWFEREGANALWNAENWGMTRPEEDFPICPAHAPTHW